MDNQRRQAANLHGKKLTRARVKRKERKEKDDGGVCESREWKGQVI
jgi:hypothetical protein